MRTKLSIAVAAAAVAVGVGSADAGVTVYNNDFSKRGEFRAIKKLSGGKACTKSWRQRRETFGFTVKRGKRRCAMRTPVIGESSQPDQEIRAKVRLNKETPKSVARKAYVGLKVRATGKVGYEFRLYPLKQRYELIRSPGGAGFPVTGVNRKATKKFPRTNRIQLKVQGGKLTAKINKTKVIKKLADGNPLAEVGGRRVAITFGSLRDTRKDAVGFFDDLRVGIPGV